jgi:hypothetical protein
MIVFINELMKKRKKGLILGVNFCLLQSMRVGLRDV